MCSATVLDRVRLAGHIQLQLLGWHGWLPEHGLVLREAGERLLALV